MTGETRACAEVQIFIPCALLTSEFCLIMIDSDLGISFLLSERDIICFHGGRVVYLDLGFQKFSAIIS